MNDEDEREAKRRARIYASLDGKKKLRAKNINACQVCGWESPDFLGKTLLRLHHVFPGNEDQLVLLCPNCHALADRLGNIDRGLPRRLTVQIASMEELLTSLRDLREKPDDWKSQHEIQG
jgi:predicted HNH restriction endonuclease